MFLTPFQHSIMNQIKNSGSFQFLPTQYTESERAQLEELVHMKAIVPTTHPGGYALPEQVSTH